MPTRRVIISDVHLSAAAAVAPPSGQPYAWCMPDHVERLAAFLRSPMMTGADKLIIAGDFIDAWICPIDVRPPLLEDVIAAPHNAPVMDAIRSFAELPGRETIYVPGNHDMAMTADIAKLIHPRVVFGSHYDEAPLRVRHGHEESLFNAPDPTGRTEPLGYWMSRFSATGINRGRGQVSADFWTILQSGPELAAALAVHALTDAVFDVTLSATGLTVADRCTTPWGSTIGVGELRATFANLMQDWSASRPSSALTAVLCEWNPYNAIPVGKQHLHVVGHSHQRLMSTHPSYGAYFNTGTWCSAADAATFVVVEDAEGGMTGQVFDWDGASATSQSDAIFVAR